MDYTYLANLAAEFDEIPEDSIVSKTLHKDGKHKAILFGFAPGQELSEHTAAVPAMLYFVKGEAELTLGEDSMSVGPGAWAQMPANLAHSIVAKTPVVMLLVMG
ncbi:MAG: cupin domain-containing protein [Anaerolineae bacterium]|nr:cupin domain-containing protein [Anaerolineae bacterium]